MDSKIAAYARRSVQIVALAQRDNAAELRKIVSPNAEFSIGSGDVGRPFANGIEGAITAGKELSGTPRYRFKVRSGPPPGPDDPCSAIKLEVEFYSRDESIVIPMTFSYDHGVLESATGWMLGESAGEVDAAVAR